MKNVIGWIRERYTRCPVGHLGIKGDLKTLKGPKAEKSIKIPFGASWIQWFWNTYIGLKRWRLKRRVR